MLTEQREIHALVSLIEDPDVEIQLHVKQKIMTYGKDAVFHLEKAWMNPSTDKPTQNRIEQIVHEIQYEYLVGEFENWVVDGADDLLQGLVLISQYSYPDISMEIIRKYLDKIKQDIWLELNHNLTAFEKIEVFNKVFFDIYGFKGNRKNYHSPNNSYINNVLESKRGNPLSLSMIYMIVARELELPLFGINLPNHFVLGYVDEDLSRVAGIDSTDLVFYVNPYNRGALLMHDDVEKFLSELDLPLKDEFMLPCTTKDMVLRNLNNLIYAYRTLKEKDKVEELKGLRNILS
jgi:regulator of sirC expression with transglutaminase-like and TPR domain